MITRESLQIGAIRIVPDRNLIIKGNDTYSLEPRIMDVLYVLASNAGTVLSRDDLIDLVWKVEHGADESLTRAISVIRKTIRSAGEDEPYIETIPRRGYRLAQPVALIDAPTEPETPVFVPPNAPVASTPALISTVASLEIAEKNISNMWRPNYFWLLAGGLIVLCGLIVFWSRGGDTAGSTITANSVVVLPFSNLSGNPEFDYMTRGISAELRSELMRNEVLKVVAQHTSKVVKTSNLDSKDISEQLGVAFILDGSLTRTKDGLSMSAELINAKTGYSQWSKNYIADEDRLLQIQNSMVKSIVQAVTKDVDGLFTERQGGPQRAAAFNNYLLGLDAWKKAATPDDAQNAVLYYDEAIRLDPTFALAYSEQALILSWISSSSSNTGKAEQSLDAARQAAQKAVTLGPELAETHSALGWVEYFGALNVAEAEPAFEKSLALGKGSASILARYALFAAFVGKPQKAKDAISKAVTLDPLNASTHNSNAMISYFAGDFEQALSSSQTALNFSQELGTGWYWRSMSEMQLGLLNDAQVSCEKEPLSDAKYVCAGIINILSGDSDGAEKYIQKLDLEYGVSASYQKAQLLSQLGHMDDAIDALKAALEAKDAGLAMVYSDPLLRPLRELPEFSSLLSKIGFDGP